MDFGKIMKLDGLNLNGGVTMRKPLIAGNWKMYKTSTEAVRFVETFKKLMGKTDVEVVLCVPFTQLWAVKEAIKDTRIKLGAQNMHYEEEGAFTGEISPVMLKEIGIDFCIIGHSERRAYYNETDDAINKKLISAFAYSIIPILCVGETLEERDANRTEAVVKGQLTKDLLNLQCEQVSQMVIAYEPIWAIGTGRTATPEQANETIAYIREIIRELYDEDVSESVRIQYGGSVKPDNVTQIMNQEDIDGALVGGASLKPHDFIEIVNF